MERDELLRLTPANRRALEELATRAQDVSIPRHTGERRTPLSFPQQRLWFLDRYAPGGASYNIPVALRLYGVLDAEALRRALETTVMRHELLRTHFTETDGVPFQIVGDPVRFELPTIDLESYPAVEKDAALSLLVHREAERAFDLTRDVMLRATLYRLRETDHVLLLNLHHIAGDAWSLGILMGELSVLYGAALNRTAPVLPELPIQYADYAAWQRRRFTGAVLQEKLAWWREALKGAPMRLDLPADRPRPPRRTHRGGAEEPRLLPAALAGQLRNLGQGERATLFMTLAAGWAVLLSRYTGRDDIVVGTAGSGRDEQETQPLIGFFINTIALRVDLSGEPSFRAMLARVRDAALRAYAHQDLPFEALVEALAPPRSLSYAPLFQSMITLQNVPAAPLVLPGLVAGLFPLERRSAKFDLTLSLIDMPAGIGVELEYDSDLFDASTVRRMLRHYETLLAAAAGEPDKPVTRLPLMGEEARRAVVAAACGPATDYPSDANLADLFALQATKTPDAIAIVTGAETITYAALDARAEALAEDLRGAGIGPDIPVAICLDRGLDLVVAQLAVLKAGGAYVPISPAYPPARRSWMLKDCRATVLIGDGAWRGEGVSFFGVSGTGAPQPRSGEGGCGTLQPRSGEGGRLAYIMYTSGSTGLPKGVAVPHRAVARLVMDSDYVRLTSADVVAQASNVAFDAATFEIWGALLNGARLVFLPAATLLSPLDLAAALARENITTLFLTTALFHEIARIEPRTFGTVTQLLFGGETADPRLVARVLESGAPPRRLLHVYGPTETTTFAAWHLVDHVEPDAASVPIGRPIANTEILVLDRWKNLAPVGIRGELYVGGPGLARSYWQRPKLTAEKFVPHPFRQGEVLYRTGDFARLRLDGTLDFLGRADRQVKIRGFRVEPGEIETLLRRHKGVADALVLTEEGRILAWAVPSPGSGGALDAEALLASLKRQLPPYMIPSGLRLLESFPLNANGKIDRKALPPVDEEDSADAKRAATPLELELVLIFRNLLGRRRVGTDESFFDLGGHSLLAVRLLDAIEKATGRRLPLATLFAGPTVRDLAAAIMSEGRSFYQSALVPLQPEGSRAPFFFLHGDFNSAGFYTMKLAGALGPDQPFYVFHPHGLAGEPVPASIEDMAADYLQRLREVRPRGPYLLGGHCNGGLVALEMARALREAGEDVDLLVIMDAFAQDPWVTELLAKTPRALPAEQPRSPRELGSWYEVAVARYVPRPYGGPITVFRPHAGNYPVPDLGWGKVAPEVEVRVMPGTHIHAITRNIEKTAALLRQCLDAAHSRRNPS